MPLTVVTLWYNFESMVPSSTNITSCYRVFLDPALQVRVHKYENLRYTNPKSSFIFRSWQHGDGGGGWCAVAETSVAHGSAPTEGARGVVLASRYLAQPAGKGRSRLVHLARVDTM